MIKEESIMSNSTKKALEDEGYPFKKISKDVDDGFVEDDWYELRGTNSLWCYYSEIEVQYILQKCTEK